MQLRQTRFSILARTNRSSKCSTRQNYRIMYVGFDITPSSFDTKVHVLRLRTSRLKLLTFNSCNHTAHIHRMLFKSFNVQRDRRAQIFLRNVNHFFRVLLFVFEKKKRSRSKIGTNDNERNRDSTAFSVRRKTPSQGRSANRGVLWTRLTARAGHSRAVGTEGAKGVSSGGAMPPQDRRERKREAAGESGRRDGVGRAAALTLFPQISTQCEKVAGGRTTRG